tara:strand:- start:895 stop:1647 length:753 start_codon:yes stop_codon:yes gene_type:complete
MERKLLELLIDEDQMLAGVEAVSLVAFPAIETNFVYLSQDTPMTFATDDEKQLLVGPALIPDKRIFRIDEKTGEEYDVYFSEETVRQAMELFMREQRTNEHTIEHQAKVAGLTVVESWTIEDPKKDKAALYGFDLPKGTWMLSVKVNNRDVWEQVKDKKYRGFSIEGYFTDRLVEMERQASKLCVHCPEDQETIAQLQSIMLEELTPAMVVDKQPIFEKLQHAQVWAEAFGDGSFTTMQVDGKTYFKATK